MAVLQFSDTVRNARLDTFESTIGTAAKLRIFTGTVPTNCAAVDSGTLIADLTLPSDWMTAAATGVKGKNGAWTGVGHANAGAGMDAGHFRIKNSAGTVTHCQGDITITGGAGAMTLDSINIATSQPVNVTTFTLTDGNG
jgi:hypothetical protein